MKIVFATNNSHKLQEIRQILGDKYDIVSLSDIGCHEDIPETGATLEENAMQKAQYVYEKYGIDCFADDTGLEVDALGGEPGVHSARYAEGTDHDSEANMAKLLRKLQQEERRTARFRTVIALIQGGKAHEFEGRVEGTIAHHKHGTGGFGYDPIFIPEGHTQSFAEMGEEKNKISHRARAVEKLCQFLISLIALLINAALPSHGQQLGTWQLYPSYADITQIEPTGGQVFVLASGGLFSYNPSDQQVVTYDKVTTLSDNDITHIAWNNTSKRLVIAYDNSNIDLLSTSGEATNVNGLKQYTTTTDKTINSIYISGQYAYLATGFGIVKVNTADASIQDTYQLGFSVDYCYLEGNYIYAASESDGLWCGLLSDNLLDKNQWTRVGDYTQQQTDRTLVKDPSNNWWWTVSDDGKLTYFKQDTDGNRTYMTEGVMPDGPASNNFGNLYINNGKLYAVSGYWSQMSNSHRPGEVHVWDGTSWTEFEKPTSTQLGYDYQGTLCMAFDPSDANHVFVGATSGMYEFQAGKFINNYTYDNSGLESALTSYRYTMVTALQYDSSNKLWVFNSMMQNPIKSYTKQTDTWQTSSVSFSNEGRRYDLKKVFTSSHNGLMWMVNNYFAQCMLYAFDPVNDKLYSWGPTYTNEDGTPITPNYVFTTAEDRDGNVWIGTTSGPLYLSASNIQSGDATFTQHKVPRNDGTNLADYLLSGISISAMAVDGANRKWFGTNGYGVFLVSADNNEQLQHFTSSNSSLISDNVQDIVIDPTTGCVYFSTDKGLCSYMSDATAPVEKMSKDNTYAYPNPVKPDYTGVITVTGLSFDADVKIVTVNGTLVAEGRSNGGMFTWDGRDLDGKRVASGIYMVETATSDGSSGTVCKIAVIR